jgi:hypothetical protein
MSTTFLMTPPERVVQPVKRARSLMEVAARLKWALESMVVVHVLDNTL